LREFTDVARRLPRALIGWLLWQLRSHLPEATGARLASYGSLYAVVESLQKHNLITALETNRDGRRPERTIYAITPDGVEEFEDCRVAVHADARVHLA
jgi:DNA-binding PadR family transcriptional regulator